MKKKRPEKDAIGIVFVPADRYYGAQTARSLINFDIGDERFSHDFIKTVALIKKICAKVNSDYGLISKKKAGFIKKAVNEILADRFVDQFPVSIWQTGSGTQINMNVNEVISNRANELSGSRKGKKSPVHPNDDVNLSQSSNDVIPTAMHISTVFSVEQNLLPTLKIMIKILKKKSVEFKSVTKIGRTHLMDALPITLGNEFSAYSQQLEYARERIQSALKGVYELAIGGTAVGTGFNSHPKFASGFIKEINKVTKKRFKLSRNKFAAIASHDALVELSGAFRTCAVSLTKIANDIRWMVSGPRCGLGEIQIPANEPGSSIMPGKVNPTQCEAMLMICAQVMGNDVTVGIAGSGGNFELNTYKPVIIVNILQSVRLLSDGCRSFTEKCLNGIKPIKQTMNQHVQNSLMLATALNKHIGYDQAAVAAQKAFRENMSLKDAVMNLGLMSEKRFSRIVNPKKMMGPSA